MVSFDNEKKMYDLFIDKEILTTQELLSVGFTNKDLTRLIENGKLKRVKRGFYELDNAKGLFKYTQILFSKRYRNLDKAMKGLKRCIEIEPENGSIQTRMFLNSIIIEDYEQALKSFEVMDRTDKENYKRDQNMWLYLLSFVTELPQEYRNRVKNMKLADMLTLETDQRYSDRLIQNRIRNAIYKYNFKEAQELSKSLLPSKDRKIAVVITEKLLANASYASVKKHETLYDLISKCKYREAESLLAEEKELHGINPADEQFLLVLRDLISILEDKKIPEVDASKKVASFNDALVAHDYKKVMKIYRCSSGRKFSKSSKFMGILLERIDGEISKLELTNERSVCEAEDVNGETVKVEDTKAENSELFSSIAASLLKQDVDTAFSLLEDYLASIDKSNFRGYVADLIKLSVLEKDTSFKEPILLLSVLSRDEFDFNVAAYIQDFYFNVARKKFKEAAIYLDILSMSEQLGGLAIPTNDLKEKLIEDAAREGVSKEELGLKEKEVIVVEEAKVDEASKENKDAAPLETIESIIDVPYSITDALDDILDDTNMIMLEPMSDEDIASVVEAAVKVPKVQAITIQEESGEKRVVLRYYDKHGPYVNIGATLKAAEEKYRNWEYEDAIDLYQLVMPRLEKPRSFIFARLGNCYRQTTYDGDYSKAIDYYTMAMAQSSEEDTPLDFRELISGLKAKSKYNGVKVDMPVQYKKECN